MIKLSVIIPTLNEENNIIRCIESVKKLKPFEIIVVDSGSDDRTKELAKQSGAIVLESERGRGIQLNNGISVAKGDFLLFLHADSILDVDPKIFYHFLEKNPCGFFRLRFDKNSFFISLVEFFANFRARFLSLPYGDQAIFIKKDLLKKIGGFKPYPFLEDLEFVRRLKKHHKPNAFPNSIIVSSRRIVKRYPFSPILISLRNVLIVLLFMLGVSPHRLLRLYK